MWQLNDPEGGYAIQMNDPSVSMFRLTLTQLWTESDPLMKLKPQDR
jgi:hypothetical protein